MEAPSMYAQSEIMNIRVADSLPSFKNLRRSRRQEIRFYFVLFQVNLFLMFDFTSGLTHAHRTIPDIRTTPETLGPLVAKSNTFILLQNGVGIEHDLRVAVPDATIISGCAWIDATAVDGGKRVDHFSLVSNEIIIQHSEFSTCCRDLSVKRSRSICNTRAMLSSSAMGASVRVDHLVDGLRSVVDVLWVRGGVEDERQAGPDPSLTCRPVLYFLD